MAFTNDTLTKLSSKALLGGVLDGSKGAYFESRSDFVFNLGGDNVWTEMSKLKNLKAKTFANACQNTVDNPSVLRKYGYDDLGNLDGATAIKMNEVLGTNGTTFVVYQTPDDYSSKRLQNFIAPVLIPQDNSAPSVGYTARFFIGGPPNAGGVELSTVEGFDGDVAWYFNYASGVLLFDEALAPPSAAIPSKEIWMVAFQYKGQTATDASGFSGSVIDLEADDGSLWRINASDGTHLHFERYDTLNDGTKVWNTYQYIGSSTTTDGVTIARPYTIEADLNPDAMNAEGNPDLRSVFKVSGTDDDFVFGNSQQNTVIETKEGSDIKRAASLSEGAEFENRPLKDLEVVIDNTIATGDQTTLDYAWVSNINYTQQTDYIRFNEILFDVLETLDENGDPVDEVPVRISVETLDGNLIQENLSVASLNAGINGGFNFKVGEHFYVINPKYSDVRFAETITRLTVAKGYKIKLAAGEYEYTDSLDNDAVKTQVVPYQRSKVEFLDHAAILDESNYRRLIHENSQVILDAGLNTFYEGWSHNIHQLVGIGEHTLANRPVLGNYENETFIATGSGGLFVLFQDDTAREEFWSEGDRKRLQDGFSPTYFIETKELELDLNGIFASELDRLQWDIVNLAHMLPLIRYEGDDVQSYRVSISSTVLETVQFQENMTLFDYENKVISDKHLIYPSIDAVDPKYTQLALPRQAFTVNRETPRKILFQFEEPVKLYGYYKDPTDPNDPVGTGTFVPSVKADVFRIFEEPVVTGNDLEDRVDQIEGANEWRIATDQNLPTLHLESSLLVLADEDGEWLLWSDIDNIYSDTDIHQWIFETGVEAYFELDVTQGSYLSGNTVFVFDTTVVHVPYDDVTSFEVSFGWHDNLLSNTNLNYGTFTFYIDSAGRGFDSKIEINIPRNASITWRFRRRRDGSYSYIATPMNDNLASVGIGSGNDLSAEIPIDPKPPIEITT